ncbi:histidine--tRNA ligase [Actinotalea fermentans]|uniref:Histidine--tRNA ligase n=1 Tax=Actinotalea fermentans TaxID=43671 RepID=A0A511YUF6_9CELL|nr:histidine--tRNA ligase [Actinotalea fermentans]KGM15747.1 histidyl-tRNA synthase [Actinotalea fermentans ATCC 43279 = JCM 9966 = DSM 3133]GEN78832.1 histidine--tRNA ligase [Actinotalea fermentans]
MARPTPLSGFPELLPAERVVEQHVLDTMRRTFELHGFAGIETRAVEPLDQLLRKGETSKEIYVLRRLQEEDAEPAAGGQREAERGLGLHFDLTVPFARFVLENAGHLQFPFRRYQIQKVWRGERPQDGRFREFVQADVDVVGAGELPAHYEAELPLVMADAFAALADVGVPPVRILVNNRRVMEGFARGIGLDDVDAVLRSVDKLAKVGPEAVAALLADEAGASPAQAAAMLELAALRGEDAGVVDRVHELAARHGAANELLDQGLAELGALLEVAARRAPGRVVADLAIARGLDYYTGAVYESVLVGHEDLGSICSGGRYDALASDGTTTYPGVGLSIGVSRLVSRLLSAGLVRATRGVPSAVVVAVTSEETRAESEAVAAALRARGIPVEVAPSAAKFGKQIRYADRRGVPFVWFPASSAGDDGAIGHQVKDIRSGEQVPADAATWEPPAQDRFPRVVPGTPAQ